MISLRQHNIQRSMGNLEKEKNQCFKSCIMNLKKNMYEGSCSCFHSGVLLWFLCLFFIQSRHSLACDRDEPGEICQLQYTKTGIKQGNATSGILNFIVMDQILKNR